jgi:hypothetical protein
MVARFYLGQSQLADANVGLGGPSPSVTLDSSTLDGPGVLDGTTFTTPATAAASLGVLSASAIGTVTPVIVASADAPLGGVLAEVSEVNVEVVADAQSDLGALSASASGTVTTAASAEASLGQLVAAATAGVTIVAEASAGLGEATSAAVGGITVFASAEGVLGGLVASANGAVSTDAVGDAPLGGLSAAAVGTVVPPTPPEPPVVQGGGRPNPYRRARQKPKKVEPVVDVVPEIVVANPKTVLAYCTPIVASVKASAEAAVTFVAEDDDLQVLLML